jgi:hypothetical protein
MPAYIIYDVETGAICKTLSCQEKDLPLNVKEGQAFILKSGSVKGKMVAGGLLVDLPHQEKEAKEIAEADNKMRVTRKALLQGSDWTQVPDAPVDSAAWAVYRQELRDLPDNTTDPRNVVWPEPPS